MPRQKVTTRVIKSLLIIIKSLDRAEESPRKAFAIEKLSAHYPIKYHSRAMQIDIYIGDALHANSTASGCELSSALPQQTLLNNDELKGISMIPVVYFRSYLCSLNRDLHFRIINTYFFYTFSSKQTLVHCFN